MTSPRKRRLPSRPPAWLVVLVVGVLVATAVFYVVQSLSAG